MRYIYYKAKTYIFVCLSLLAIGCGQKDKKYDVVDTFEKEISIVYEKQLEASASYLDSLNATMEIEKKRDFYAKARKNFKLLEPVLAHTDKNNYKSLNAPNILIVKGEESLDLKVMNPIGFQVIEETLYEDTLDTLALKNLVNVTSARLKLIKNNLHLQLKEYHIIWLLREQITRIATTGITGFDSPVLNQSLLESSYTYETLKEIVKLNRSKFSSKDMYAKVIKSFEMAQFALKTDFNAFDRFDFIQNHTDPQLKLLLEVQEDWKVQFPFELGLSNNMHTLFSESTLNKGYFSDKQNDTVKIIEKEALGKALFNDVSLSKNYNMSCASCHIKDLAFTDGKRVFDKNQTRNTPTLTYSAYQKGFFMDSRAGSLEGQVVGVVKNHNEFNTSMDSVIARVFQNNDYKKSLETLYGNKRVSYNIRHAIASYIKSLNAFSSKFDKNIRGEENTLTQNEKKGFNLFMGKALCATCHFAPVFNGTVPPNYLDTEMEAIGTPNLAQNGLSEDLGRYDVFKTEARKHFFKTPTIRNIGKTSPYMHNGVFKTLEEVVDFYSKGGGVGLGFDLPNQTLPFDNLELTDQEIKELVSFMETLTDE
ncbi:cytochrome c peroxidase [Tenacibaculum sp. MAR_2009_124]|uniref:cytochrome-c peroxidase n=1 Tax=Tenacibaculum sp. MAR_2009_124 TaxID=1250059 RepID=UPI0008955977|nr:cytochrome c peroxidase [Tenacibaculum sp. MAR_2009_124]SEB43009.1 cytochrome c peroxidase [Tenacibaculum sp. MAR_2009_124]